MEDDRPNPESVLSENRDNRNSPLSRQELEDQRSFDAAVLRALYGKKLTPILETLQAIEKTHADLVKAQLRMAVDQYSSIVGPGHFARAEHLLSLAANPNQTPPSPSLKGHAYSQRGLDREEADLLAIATYLETADAAIAAADRAIAAMDETSRNVSDARAAIADAYATKAST